MFHRDGGGHSPGRMLATLAAVVLCFALAVVGIMFLGRALDREDVQEVRGGLSERFVPSLTTEVDGTTYAYREFDLQNVLVMGVDSQNISAMKKDFRSGGQSDFMLVLSMDRNTGRVTPLQLDRDTMTPVRMYGILGNYTGIRVTQLCLSHAFGRTPEECSENTCWAVSNFLLNVPIDHYIALDLNGINTLNEAIGGVTVYIDEDLTAADPAFVEGTTITLHGDQAEHFVRTRKTISDGHNTSRMKRQRAYMEAALNQIKALVSADQSYAEKIFDALGDHITTDMSRGALINTVYNASKYDWNDFVEMTEGVHELDKQGFMTFVPDEEATQRVVLSTFFEQYTPVY